MRCLFEDDHEGVENFDAIWTEYIDISGIAESRDKDLLVAIHNVDVRLFVVPEMIVFQKKFFAEWEREHGSGMPYIDGFWFFKKHGHRLKWNEDDPGNFFQQLEFVEIKERKFIAERDDLRKQQKLLHTKGVAIDGNGRREFIKLLNAVGKYRRNDIDRDKTDMETYAYMIKDYFESAPEKVTDKAI